MEPRAPHAVDLPLANSHFSFNYSVFGVKETVLKSLETRAGRCATWHDSSRLKVLSLVLAVSVASVACGGGGGEQVVEAPEPTPAFGPLVAVLDPSMTTEQINAAIAPQTGNPRRHVFFKPGTYGSAAGENTPSTAAGIVNASLNANTYMAGLGKLPGDVKINGALSVPATAGALGTFYRSLANMTINPIQPGQPAHRMAFVTSQTSHWRRVELQGDLDVAGDPSVFAFGNMIANSKISGKVIAGEGQNTATQTGKQTNAMYYIRDSQIGSWQGFSAKMVFSGVSGAPANNFGPATATSGPGDKVTLAATPVTREAPFIYLDNDKWRVFVPSVRTNSSGINWDINAANGQILPISDFYIAQPSATAAILNAQLDAGKNLILTPGTYNLEAPLQIKRSNTVVMGLGFAMLQSANTSAIVMSDVQGVSLSSFTVNTTGTPDILVQLGTSGVKSGAATNPTTLNDVHMANSSAVTAMVIHQDHVLLDGSWIRRGGSFAWETVSGSTGLVINGESVTVLGLWLEHFKKTHSFWNGNNGRAVFFQNEPPYTPPSQAVWMNGTKEGYPGLKVADSVTSFRLDGFGSYARFNNGCACFVSSAIETPVKPGVVFKGIVAGSIMFPTPAGTTPTGFTIGGFRHIINDFGPAVDAGLDSGKSRYPFSDTFGFTSSARIASYLN